MHTDAGISKTHAFGLQICGVALGVGVHLQRTIVGALAVVFLPHRSRKHHGHSVAHDAVERTFMFEGDSDHVVKVGVERGHRLTGVDGLHEGREALQVGKNEAAGLPRAAQLQRLGVLDQVVHLVRRHVAGKGRDQPALLSLAHEVVHQTAHD